MYVRTYIRMFICMGSINVSTCVYAYCMYIRTYLFVYSPVHMYLFLACQESHREDVLVSRMLRQCQQEQRIATQLMQVRKEKENIRNNRIELQRQFEERRQNDFEEYLKRQSVSHHVHTVQSVRHHVHTVHLRIYVHAFLYLLTYICNVRK